MSRYDSYARQPDPDREARGAEEEERAAERRDAASLHDDSVLWSHPNAAEILPFQKGLLPEDTWIEDSE